MKGDFRDYIYVVEQIEPVASFDGIQSEVLSQRLDSDVEDYRRSFSGGYIFKELLLLSDGNCYGGSCVCSVSGICTRFS